MAEILAYVGQRRSYSGALCTVRYKGPLEGTKGEWLGVEWDDPSRGKHDGKHEGQRIFECLSLSPTAASFVRPSRKPDPERTLIEAIRFKYAQAKRELEPTPNDVESSSIAISGKVVEEVGFDKIQKQLSLLAELRIVLVDELIVSGVVRRDASTQEIEEAQKELARTCPSIVELDIGWNTIETWQDVADVCRPFKRLKTLKASGLRLHDFQRGRFAKGEQPFKSVEELHLSEGLLRPEQVLQMLDHSGSDAFPSLRTLRLLSNEFDTFELVARRTYSSITNIVFDNNKFEDFGSLPSIFALFPNLSALSFQGNLISRTGFDAVTMAEIPTFEKLETLNLTGNQISDYAFINRLPLIFPKLISLRISRNPLYEHTSPSNAQNPSSDGSKQPQRGPQSAGAQSDSTSYYLTLARIPTLQSLNYTTITAREREEGEIYYLSVVEKEIKSLLHTFDRGKTSTTSESPWALEQLVNTIHDTHPLYSRLCSKYEREDLLSHAILRSKIQAPSEGEAKDGSGPQPSGEKYNAGSLGARLVKAVFYIADHKRPSIHMPPTLHSTGAPEAFGIAARKPFTPVLPTTISVYRLKSIVAKALALQPLRFRLIYESHEYDPVEPISRYTGAKTGALGDERAEWEAWGDWDVDESDTEPSEDDEGDGDDGAISADGAPSLIVRDGQRFKKREAEILDGMRPWGDFLDLDGGPFVAVGSSSGKVIREVRVRVESL